MYIGTMQEKIRCGKIARQVVDMSGMDVETALVSIEAKSEAQQNFASDVRIHAIAQIWEFLDDEYQTPEMAKAIMHAVNRRQDARFWLDNKNQDFIELFADEMEKEVEG